jgi:hypothetical protein
VCFIAPANCSTVMLVGMGGVGLVGSGYCMPLMIAWTSGTLVRDVASKVPCRMASLCSLSANGPSLFARGPVTKGVFAACRKWFWPSVVSTSNRSNALTIVLHVAAVLLGSSGTNSLSNLICSSSFSHSPSRRKMAACFSALKSCRRAVALVMCWVSARCSALSSRKVSLIFRASF